MIDPYQAIGLCPTFRNARRREQIEQNLGHIEHVARAAHWVTSLELPVRLLMLPEGALQGFTDEILDLDHEDYAREMAIDIPGPETERLGVLAASLDVFLMATAKARHPEFPGRFFNVGFAIAPSGEVVLRHHKVVPLLPTEHSLTPHNVWDRWIELYGRNLDAFYPVADTEIGRLGFMMANEAAYPENARGLAMNGCEIAYRGPYPDSNLAEIQTRARALDNNMYVVGHQAGPALDDDDHLMVDFSWRKSLIADYRGRALSEVVHGGSSTFVAATIDIRALRDFRARSRWSNWLKDLTTEQYQLIYEQPIYPKNLYLDRKPLKHAAYGSEVIDPQIELLMERGIWTRPDTGRPVRRTDHGTQVE